MVYKLEAGAQEYLDGPYRSKEQCDTAILNVRLPNAICARSRFGQQFTIVLH